MARIGSIYYIEVGFYKLKTQKHETCWIGLDTGASTTTLSRDLLYDLEYNVTDYPLTRVIAANSIEYANVVNLERLMLGDMEFNNLQVHTMDFKDNFLLGVIGLDIFTKFDVNFLFSQNIIEFTPRNDT